LAEFHLGIRSEGNGKSGRRERTAEPGTSIPDEAMMLQLINSIVMEYRVLSIANKPRQYTGQLEVKPHKKRATRESQEISRQNQRQLKRKRSTTRIRGRKSKTFKRRINEDLEGR
tara:strand:- start:383 stop:727 length:345 start_codon:yes stop_codon:yes gene_type:complete